MPIRTPSLRLRPPKKNKKKSKMVSPSKKSFLLRLEEETLDELRSLAKDCQIPLARLLRNILTDYLEDISLPKKPQKELKTPWWME